MNPKTASIIIAVAMAFAFIPSMPYGYYPVMRWVVSGMCVYLLTVSYKQTRESWVWIWGILAGIYNPIGPIHSTREIWTVLNIAMLIAVALHYRTTRKDTRGE